MVRDVERLREALNLDRAEIAPEPLAAAGRFARRFRLDLVALALLAALRRRSRASPAARRRPGGGQRRAWAASSSASSPLPSRSPRPSRGPRPPWCAGAPRSSTPPRPRPTPTGSLREGEVVPVLETSGDWLRVEDNAGARGWAHAADVRRLDGAPARAPRADSPLSAPSIPLDAKSLARSAAAHRQAPRSSMELNRDPP